jgi:hypothetical protein
LTSLHDVGIFTTGGAELVSGVVPAGTAGTFVAGTVGGTWTVAVASTILSAGTQYYIVADNEASDGYVFGTGAVTFNSAITWNGYAQSATNSITSATVNNGGVPGDLGPNFQFTTSAVPEPGSAALMLSAAALLLGGRRFLRKN